MSTKRAGCRCAPQDHLDRRGVCLCICPACTRREAVDDALLNYACICPECIGGDACGLHEEAESCNAKRARVDREAAL